MSNTEFLTLGEVATFLGWSPRIVERLAVGGSLPGTETDGQWRFRRDDLIDWLDRKLQTLDAARIAELEHRLEEEMEEEGMLARPHPTLLTTKLRPEGIMLNSTVTRKDAMLKELVALAERTGGVLNAGQLHASLVERETLLSTALPGGVAICHPRRPLALALRDNALLCFARARRAIPFGAEDGRPTQLFFLYCASDERMHLHGLARLVRVLDDATRDALRKVETAAALIPLIHAREDAIDLPATTV